MNEKQRKHFNQLWKVKAIKQVNEEESGGTIHRGLLADNERTLKLIEYGFIEGIKYGEDIGILKNPLLNQKQEQGDK